MCQVSADWLELVDMLKVRVDTAAAAAGAEP